MNCFSFRRSAPVFVATPSPKRFAGLSATTLAEILDSLPLVIEFINTSGDVFSNRPDRALGEPVYTTRLSNGTDLRCSRCSEMGTLFFDDEGTSRSRAQVKFHMPPDGSRSILLASSNDTTQPSRAQGGADNKLGELRVPQPRHLLTAADLFESSLETLPVQAWAMRIAGVEVDIGHVNSKYAEFRGISAGPLPAHHWTEGIFRDDVASTREYWARAVSTGADFTNVCRVRRASDGAYVWLREEGRPFRDATGAVIAYGCLGYVGVGGRCKRRLCYAKHPPPPPTHTHPLPPPPHTLGLTLMN